MHRNFPPFDEFCTFMWKEAKIANNPITGMQNVKTVGINKTSEDIKPKRQVAATVVSVTGNEPLSPQARDISQRRSRACYLCSGDHHLNVMRSCWTSPTTGCSARV